MPLLVVARPNHTNLTTCTCLVRDGFNQHHRADQSRYTIRTDTRSSILGFSMIPCLSLRVFHQHVAVQQSFACHLMSELTTNHSAHLILLVSSFALLSGYLCITSIHI